MTALVKTCAALQGRAAVHAQPMSEQIRGQALYIPHGHACSSSRLLYGTQALQHAAHRSSLPNPQLLLPGSSRRGKGQVGAASATDEITDTNIFPDWMQRTTLLLGTDGLNALRDTRVLVVGLGGVGSFVCEFLVRAGVGHITIVDGDKVDVSNKNRQLPALDSTVGQPKSEVMATRLRDINPDLDLVVIQEFLTPESTQRLVEPHKYDYVIDCIDSIATKLQLLASAHQAGMRVVSSMGAGGRMDPLSLRVVDISDTFGDPFAANIRRGLRKTYGINSGITCVFSTEPVKQASLALAPASTRFKRSYYGTISYIPALFGLYIAAHVINTVVGGPMVGSVKAAQKGWKPPVGRSNGGDSSSGSGHERKKRGQQQQQQQQQGSARKRRAEKAAQQQASSPGALQRGAQHDGPGVAGGLNSHAYVPGPAMPHAGSTTKGLEQLASEGGKVVHEAAAGGSPSFPSVQLDSSEASGRSEEAHTVVSFKSLEAAVLHCGSSSTGGSYIGEGI